MISRGPTKRKSLSKSTETTSDSAFDLAATSISNTPKKKKYTCFRCKGEGHFGSECFKALEKVAPLCRIPLGKSIFVVGVPNKGREPSIHLRYYSGERPTEEGIVLTLNRWKELQFCSDNIDARVDTYDNQVGTHRRHLGGNWYVSVTQGFPCVDIRKFWKPTDSEEIQATRKGISLGFAEWRNLMEIVMDVEASIPQL